MNIQPEHIDNSHLGIIINALIEHRDHLRDNCYNGLKNISNTIKRIDGPIPKQAFRDAFDNIERIKDETNASLSQIGKIHKVNDFLKDIYETEIQWLDDNRKSINNVNLSFGLEGRIKSDLRRRHASLAGINEDPPTLIGLPEKHASIVRAPYKKKGGKRNKTQKIRRLKH